MPGARCARSLACKIKKHTSLVTTVTPESPGIPRAMVLTVSFVLSPVTGLFCHRHRAVARQLDASVGASGPHDFAVRVSAARPACRRVHRMPPPTSVTIAKRPSEEAGPNRYSADFTPPSSETSENQKLPLPPLVRVRRLVEGSGKPGDGIVSSRHSGARRRREPGIWR
jgi:hypothetical protein